MNLRNRIAGLALAAAAIAACSDPPEAPAAPALVPAEESSCGDEPSPAEIGLMTSLPLYWPIDADMADFASGKAETPWQRTAIERCYTVQPLDTLSPITALAPGEPDIDPLAKLELLAVIQPRGLSPADNVALDDWVRGGGRLLLVLDPLLTGDYDIPLGDPGRPVDSAPIPPVVDRWGLAMSVKIHEVFEDGIYDAPLGDRTLTVSHPGQLRVTDAEAASCEILAKEVIARCVVGKGTVTLVADAAVFEHIEAAGARSALLEALLGFAFK